MDEVTKEKISKSLKEYHKHNKMRGVRKVAPGVWKEMGGNMEKELLGFPVVEVEMGDNLIAFASIGPLRVATKYYSDDVVYKTLVIEHSTRYIVDKEEYDTEEEARTGHRDWCEKVKIKLRELEGG